MIPENLCSICSSWFLVGTMGAISIYWLLSRIRLPYANDKIPPFPVQPWSIVGHFFMLGGNLRDKMKEWRSNAGNIYSLYIGRQLNIIVNDFEDIKEIMSKHSDNIINTPHSFTSDIMCEENKGIVTARDGNWKEQRATSVSILRSFGMGTEIMAMRIQEEVNFLIEKIVSFEGQSINPNQLLHACVSNVICSVTVGERFEHEDPRFVSILESGKNINKYVMLTTLLTPLKYLYYLPWDLFNAKKYKKATGELADFLKPYILKFNTISNEDMEPDNFISAYLNEIRKVKKLGVMSELSESNLVVIIRTLFVAGTQSTSSTIMWCLLYMLHNPHIQEKIFQEIETCVGTDRFPCMSDKPKLTYMNAVVMEVQRMASVVSTCLRREVKGSFEVRGFTIPDGSIVWPILYSVHHDKRIWGDPENFRPERFIDKKGALINREELIPFGIGRRVCLGEGLARMELFLFLSAMFQRFIFKSSDECGELPSLKECFGAVCSPEDFQIKFVSRN